MGGLSRGALLAAAGYLVLLNSDPEKEKAWCFDCDWDLADLEEPAKAHGLLMSTMPL